MDIETTLLDQLWIVPIEVALVRQTQLITQKFRHQQLQPIFTTRFATRLTARVIVGDVTVGDVTAGDGAGDLGVGIWEWASVASACAVAHRET